MDYTFIWSFSAWLNSLLWKNHHRPHLATWFQAGSLADSRNIVKRRKKLLLADLTFWCRHVSSRNPQRPKLQWVHQNIIWCRAFLHVSSHSLDTENKVRSFSSCCIIYFNNSKKKITFTCLHCLAKWVCTISILYYYLSLIFLFGSAFALNKEEFFLFSISLSFGMMLYQTLIYKKNGLSEVMKYKNFKLLNCSFFQILTTLNSNLVSTL